MKVDKGALLGHYEIVAASIRTTPRRCPYYAMFLAFVGRVDEAIRLNRKALTLDPLAPLINMNGGWTYFANGSGSSGSQSSLNGCA